MIFDLNAHTSAVSSISAAEMVQNIAAAIATIKEFDRQEPFRKMMREHGFDPDKGDMLVLPAGLDIDRSNLPRYVVFSPMIDKPIFIASSLEPKSKPNMHVPFCVGPAIPVINMDVN